MPIINFLFCTSLILSLFLPLSLFSLLFVFFLPSFSYSSSSDATYISFSLFIFFSFFSFSVAAKAASIIKNTDEKEKEKEKEKDKDVKGNENENNNNNNLNLKQTVVENFSLKKPFNSVLLNYLSHAVRKNNFSDNNNNNNNNNTSNTNSNINFYNNINHTNNINFFNDINNNNNNNNNNNIGNNNNTTTPSNLNPLSTPEFLSFSQNSNINSLNFASNFPLKKIPKRMKTAQNLSEFEKQNLECYVVSSCLSASQNKSFTLSKLMSTIQSSYFNDVNIDGVKSYLIDDISRLKSVVKRLQSAGCVDVTISNSPIPVGKIKKHI
jgi:hypothetical protein